MFCFRRCRRARWIWASPLTAPITQTTKARTDTSTYWPVRHCALCIPTKSYIYVVFTCKYAFLPFPLSDDHSRVKLSNSLDRDGKCGDYINANFVDVSAFLLCVGALYPACHELIHVVFAGLWANEGVHSSSGASQSGQRRLLEDDLAAERLCYSHDHQSEGERTGRCWHKHQLHRRNSIVWSDGPICYREHSSLSFLLLCNISFFSKISVPLHHLSVNVVALKF